MDLEELRIRITELAQGGVAKARQLTDIVKLKMANAAEKDAIRKAYTEIGKLYFSQHGLDPDPTYAPLCARIVESKEKIAYNEERIADLKRSGDISDADVEAVVGDLDDDHTEDTPV